MPTVIGELGVGFGYVARGFAMWRRRPGLMLLGMVPALLVFLVLAAVLVALLSQVGDLAAWLTPFADGWDRTVRSVLRIGLAVLVMGSAVLVATMTFTGLTLTIGDPFYERIWRQTERMLGGEQPGDGLGFWRSARDGLVLTGLGLLTALAVLVIGLLPLVGAAAGLALGIVFSGRLLAAELLTRPLEARGFDRDRAARLRGPRRWRVLGFGVGTQLCFLLPLGAVLVMPAAVVGATMLARDLLPEGDLPGGSQALEHRADRG